MAVSTSLRGRVPGQAVIEDIVSAQQDVAPRTRLARAFGLSPLASSAKSLYRAAEGEVAVGQMLNQLGPLWDVLHVVPVDDLNGRIDHLVIGPAGVFAIFTENQPTGEVRVTGDTMSVSGRCVDDLQTIRQLAASAAERLSVAAGRAVSVRPMLVVIDPTRLTVREQPEGIEVIQSRHLVRVLTRAERTLAGSEVAHVSDAADQESTWESNFTPPEKALQLSRDFGVLRNEVRGAAQIRLGWGLLGFVAASLFTWGMTVTFVQEIISH